jgi:imidazolonepropionase-like amidohydrolase
MLRSLVAFGLSLAMPAFALCQAPHRVAIHAGRLIDGKSDKPLENVLIVIEGDKIASVVAGGSAPAGVDVIDLSKATVLPGFIDTHTHVLLQGDLTAEEYDAQSSPRATRRSRFHTDSRPFANWRRKARCTRMWT